MSLGFVYVLRAGSTNRYKIGKAKDVKQRTKSHKTSSSEPLTEIYVIESNYYSEIEKRVLLRLQPYRLHDIGKEWFEVPSSDLLIDTINQERQWIDDNQSAILNAEQKIRELVEINPEDVNPIEIPATAKAVDMMAKLRVKYAEKKILDAEIEYLQHSIGIEIGVFCGMKGVGSFKFTEPKTPQFQKDLFMADHPELYEQYLKLGKPSRRLSFEY